MYRAVTDIGEVRKYLSQAPVIAFDFETAPDEAYRAEERAALDPHKTHIAGVSFSVAEGDGIYVPLAHKIGAKVPERGWAWCKSVATSSGTAGRMTRRSRKTSGTP